LGEHDDAASSAVTTLTLGPENEQIAAGGFKLFLIYLIAMQLAVQLSGPYFAPYMLKHLEMGYGTFVGLISAAFVAKIAATIVWGHFAERWGSVWILFAGGLGLIPLAWLWNLSNAIAWLTFAQIASGVAWAAYELGMLLMIFETVPAARRVRLLTWYNFASSLAVVVGAAAGAYWLKSGGFDVDSYHQLFTMSSLGRLCCVALVVPIVFPARVAKAMRSPAVVLTVRRLGLQGRAA
jgi:MFS family permease